MRRNRFVTGLKFALFAVLCLASAIAGGVSADTIFLKNGIYTMPEFLEKRYSTSVRTVMAVFWLGVYVFVNLTAILWLGVESIRTLVRSGWGRKCYAGVTGVPSKLRLRTAKN